MAVKTARISAAGEKKKYKASETGISTNKKKGLKNEVCISIIDFYMENLYNIISETRHFNQSIKWQLY